MKTKSKVALVTASMLTAVTIFLWPTPPKYHNDPEGSFSLVSTVSAYGLHKTFGSVRKLKMGFNVSGYTAAGAGTSADNASYVLAGTDTNGNQFLRNSSSGKGVVWSIPANAYIISTVAADGSFSGQEYTAIGSTLGTFPLTGWAVASGTAPAPTFTANAQNTQLNNINQAGYTASGAGTTVDNVSYTLWGLDSLGYAFFRNASSGKGISWSGGSQRWIIGTLSGAGVSSVVDYAQPNFTGTGSGPVPLTGWNVSSGTAPAPTLTANSASVPTAPIAPTFNATTTGNNTLSVNTQALTANSTSEKLNIYTDSNGTVPISGSPFAVPTPGTAVNVTLVSGTQYYARLTMVGSGGSTNGPIASILFDTPAPLLTSSVISSNGNALVLTFSEASLPLQNTGIIPSLTGLINGPVTLSSPVYSGNTISYTLSRTVSSSETGGVLSALAGAFKDSASPTNNQSSAFSNVVVTNSSTQSNVTITPSSVLLYGNQIKIMWAGVQNTPVIQSTEITSIDVTGAGSSSSNANYVTDIYAVNGAPLFSKQAVVGSDPCVNFDGTKWNVYSASAGAENLYALGSGITSYFPPSGTATTLYGIAPAPTFKTNPTGADFPCFGNHGLTLTGIGGSAVTLSNVSTTNNITTATISRSVNNSEVTTGSRLVGLSRGFKDSASHLSASFSIPISVLDPPTNFRGSIQS